MIQKEIHKIEPEEQYPVNPFDFATDLYHLFSSQDIHLVMYMDKPVQYDHLQQAVETASQGEPITRCRIVRQNDTLFWKRSPVWCTPDHLVRLSSPDPESLLYEALSFPLDPYQGRLFQVILIASHDRTGDIIVFNAHHIVMDGRGLKDFSGLVMSCYAAYESGKQIELSETPMHSRELPSITTLVPDHRLIQDPDKAGWCSPISVPISSLQADRNQHALLTFSPDRSSLIHTERKMWGITVNDLMMAALARTIISVLPENGDITVPLYSTIDLRRYLPEVPERSLVNFSTTFETRIPVMAEESLEATGRRVHLLMNRKKSSHPGVDETIEAENQLHSGFTKAMKAVESSWAAIQKTGQKTTIFSNTGVFSIGQKCPGKLSIRNSFFLPGFFQPPGFFFLLSTFINTMTISATYAVPAYDPDIVSRMLHHIDQDLPGHNQYPGTFRIIG